MRSYSQAGMIRPRRTIEASCQGKAANFFRFSTDGAQWMAGLGDYAYKDKGYRTVVTVAEDYSFPYSQVQGFMAGEKMKL